MGNGISSKNLFLDLLSFDELWIGRKWKNHSDLNLILRFLVHPRNRLNIFDHIFVFTPSLTQDPAFRALADENLVDSSIVYASNELDKDLISWLINCCSDHEKFTDEFDILRDDTILIFIDDFCS